MYLRPATSSDDKIFASWRAHLRIETMTCRPISPSRKRQSVVTPTLRCALSIDPDGEPMASFSVFDYNSRNRSAEFGFVMDPAMHGRGFAGKVIGMGINCWFLISNLNKLYCQTASFNHPSCHTLEKLGLHRDAVLRMHHELDGELYDDFVYSLLRNEWEQSSWRCCGPESNGQAERLAAAWQKLQSS